MGERKYVIFVNEDTGKEYAVIFARDLSHLAVARGVEREMGRNEWGPRLYLTPVAAGFITPADKIDPDRISESLKLGPRPEDQNIIFPSLRPELPLVVSAADGPVRAPVNPKPKRSLMERAKGARAR